MELKDLFEKFNHDGKLLLPDTTVIFNEIPWSKHPAFEGIISGNGICINNGAELTYEPGVISIFPIGLPHEVLAGPDWIYLFAKFIPALF